MKSEKQTYKIRLLVKCLGTAPKDKDVYASYIATKGENAEEEIETVEEIEEKGWTGFHKDDKGIFIYSYMILGFLKTALEVMMENGEVKKIPAYKKWIDNMVFVWPRRLYWNLEKADGVLERPLRAMTPKGPRVTVTRSDYVDEGRELEFEIEVLKNSKGITQELIAKLLEYGKYQGLGQWRGSGRYGEFEVVPVA